MQGATTGGWHLEAKYKCISINYLSQLTTILLFLPLLTVPWLRPIWRDKRWRVIWKCSSILSIWRCQGNLWENQGNEWVPFLSTWQLILPQVKESRGVSLRRAWLRRAQWKLINLCLSALSFYTDLKQRILSLSSHLLTLLMCVAMISNVLKVPN